MNALVRTLVAAVLLPALAWAQEPPEEPASPAAPQITEAEALAPLEAAYQKEYAYLVAEKEGLEQRVAAQAREADSARAQARAEIDQLEARLTALQVQVERTESLLGDVERAATSALEAQDALDAAWFQAANSLERPGTDLVEPDPEGGLASQAAAFRGAFEVAADRVVEAGRVRAVEGTWFAADGTEVTGRQVLVGNIATFGVVGGAAEALVPTGREQLQGWRDGGGATGDALVADRTEPVMGLFLHEGRTKRIDERDPKTLQDILEAGGLVGYVILGLGALAILLMLARIGTLAAAGGGRRATDAAIAALARGDRKAALDAVAGQAGSGPRVVARLIPELDRPREALEDVASEALLLETPRIERFGSSILVVAAVAPLLGLLGTVTGMIATFDIITEFGTGDPRMLSGGISAALVTTQFGLIVAIPALLGGNLLSGWGEGLLARVENAALRVLNALEDPEGDDGGTMPDEVRDNARPFSRKTA